ncbi:MAG: hypothetical protein KJI71_01655 [Patescibacteria group bacterium]|nr:hypothetical protein [Patescibacteria group bacterium]
MTKESDNQRAIASLNLAMKTIDEERLTKSQLEKISKDDFKGLAQEGRMHQLRALMNTTGHPVANAMFTYYSNLLDVELGCELPHQSAALIRQLLNLTWGSFKMALTFHQADSYQTKKKMLLKGMGEDYILDKAQLSYRDYDKSNDEDIELD